MAVALQKQSNSAMTTAQQLYRSQWAKTFAEVMDIIAARWKLVLYQKRDGQQEPAPLLIMWRDSLQDQSPLQMREGLRLYMCTENGHFEPSPGDIRANAPERATDRPRKTKNPDCPDCRGTGYRLILVDSIIHPGKKAQRVTGCYCVRVEYDGKTYTDDPMGLPPAQEQPAAEIVKRLSAKVSDIQQAAKPMPSGRMLSETELQEKKLQALEVAKKFE